MNGTAAVVNNADAGANEGAALQTEWESLPGPSLAEVEPQQAEGTASQDAGSAGKDAAGVPVETAAGAAGAPKPGEQKDAVASPNADEWAVEQALLDKLFADPTHGAFAKSLHEKYQKALGWREHFANLDEAREFKAMAPGGIEELKGLVTSAQEAKAENAEFASGDPARQAAALQSIAADMPEAFATGAKPYLETLRAANPDAYRKVGMELAGEALKADGFAEMLAPIFSALAKGENASEQEQAAAGEALGQLYQWAEKAGFREASGRPAGKAAEQKLSPEIQRALEENKAYKENEQKQILEGYNSWKETTDTNFKTAVNAETAKLIEAAVPKNMPTKAREALVSRLSNEMFAAVEKKLNADTDLGEKAAKVIANGAWRTNGEKAREQVQNLWFGRAKQVLPFVAAEILNPFAEATVAANQARVEKENQNPPRKEINNGAPAGSGQRKLTPKDVKGLSDEQILEL